MEERGIDPLTSRMLSERSTIWATPPQTHPFPTTYFKTLPNRHSQKLSTIMLYGKTIEYSIAKGWTL